jgi:hypothetical protein
MKKTVLSLLMMLTACLATAQGPATVIRGRVIDANTGLPVTNAHVRLAKDDSCVERKDYISDRSLIARSNSDASGGFTFVPKALPAGPYCIGASHAPLLDGYVVVDPAHPPQNIQIELRRAAVIAGRVLDETGRPRGNMEINAVRCCEGIDGGTMDYLGVVAAASTDDQGEYRLFGLEPGSYYVWARKSRDCENCGAPNWAPTFYPGVVETSLAAKVAVLSGSEARADFALVAQKNYRIRLEVELPPEWPAETLGASTADVFISPIQRDISVSAWWDHHARVSGGRKRMHTSGWLPPGVYDVRVSAVPKLVGGGAPDYCSDQVWGEISVEIIDRDVDAPKVRLERGVTLRGFVTDNHGQRPRITGKYPDRPTVDLRPMEVGFSPGCNWELKDDGSFVLPNIPKGRYGLELHKLGEMDFDLAAVRYGGRDVLDSGFRLDSEPEGPFELVLGGRLGSVDGIVRNAVGDAVPRARVALIPPPSRRENEKNFRITDADDNGAFRFLDLRPGDYTAIAWAGKDGLDQNYLRLIFARNYLEPDFPAILVASGVRVNLESGAARTVSLRAIPKPR